MHDAHGEPSRALLDRLQLGLEIARLVERRPLKGRPGLGHEGGDRQRQLAEGVTVGPRHAQPLEHAAREVHDGEDIFHGLRGLADHEIALEIGDAVLPEEIAGGQELLVGDDFPDDPAQPLRARLRRHGQRPVSAAVERGHEILGQAVCP